MSSPPYGVLWVTRSDRQVCKPSPPPPPSGAEGAEENFWSKHIGAKGQRPKARKKIWHNLLTCVCVCVCVWLGGPRWVGGWCGTPPRPVVPSC